MERTEEVEVVFDEERARRIFPLLVEAYEGSRFPWLSRQELPEEKYFPHTLEKGSCLHRCFSFLAALFMRGGIKSDVVYKALSMTFEIEPWIFMPNEVVGYEPKDIQDVLARFKGAFGYLFYTGPRYWIANTRELREQYKGDPANIFKDRSTREVWQLLAAGTRKKTKIFPGIGLKIASLIIIWFGDAGFINSRFAWPPVDFHSLRVAIAAGVLQLIGLKVGERIHKDKVLDIVNEEFAKFFQKYDINASSLAGAIWLLSRQLCVQQPKKCHLCPIEDFCEYFVPRNHYYGDKKNGIKGGRIKLELKGQLDQTYLKLYH